MKHIIVQTQLHPETQERLYQVARPMFQPENSSLAQVYELVGWPVPAHPVSYHLAVSQSLKLEKESEEDFTITPQVYPGWGHTEGCGAGGHKES